ncbi:flavin reductase family protein [Nitrospina watsonii]|uniref:Flavin_Reduct domain-containing protein n=1 Tax=Nitrospina watsonii TaxID=1323948 RepID=A0ABN8W2A9_9BACT|nr:flavin reductase family protein [Nitrospina watsonii]CAI2719139.1 Flavin_Reduct domain-containing protein [Nitrospina watsonii]
MTPHHGYSLIRPEDHFWVEVYHLMNSIVQPRPIAWISSLSADGKRNLAPFSYFNICSMNPPMVSNSIFFNRDGSEKDTLKNIKATGEYVVGVVSFEASDKANISSAPFDSGIDEFEEAEVAVVERGPGKPPFIAESPVQLVCELNRTVPLGSGAGTGTLVLGDVREIHLSDSLKSVEWQKGIPPEMLNNVGRMGADFYTKTTDLFRMERPTVKK